MKIGILGAGNIGATAARLFVAAGHDVAISNSRGPDSLRELIRELGPQAHAMTIRDAARFGDGGFYDLGGSTSSEEVLKRLPGSRLVKAFNTIYYAHLASRGRKDLPIEERHTIYLAGDNAEAKALVARLIEEIGFAAIDTGSLREGGRLQEPESPIYNKTYNAREARHFLATLEEKKA